MLSRNFPKCLPRSLQSRLLRNSSASSSFIAILKRGLHSSTQSRSLKWVIQNDDGFQSPHSAFYIVLPNVPNETPENNLFLESVACNSDWPPMSSAMPDELYQGTLKLLLELGASLGEHVEMLENELKKNDAEFTFEKVLAPLLKDEGDAHFALTTIQLKMLTDWPECESLDWKKDFEAINKLHTEEMTERTMHQVVMDAVRRIPESELAKIDEWKRRLVEILKLEWDMQGYQPDPTKIKWQKRKQTFINGLIQEGKQYGNRYLTSLLYDPAFANVEVSIRDRRQLKHVPPKILGKLANGNDPEEGPWTASTDSSLMFDLLKYSNAREQKRELWNAWVARSSFASSERMFNNSITIEEMRSVYERFSQQLNFRSTAHHQLSTKMIGNPETLREFIAGLYHRFRPVLIQRYDYWNKHAEEEEDFVFGHMQNSDLFYICRREAEHCHGVDTLELMKYFPGWATFEKILALLRMVLSIDFKEINEKSGTASFEKCHPSVRVYEVTDRSDNEYLGRLYVDAFSRSDKTDCGWQAQLWRLADKDRGLDKLVWMTGNLDKEDGLLHYEELQQMLEAFGKALQMLLSRSPYIQLAFPHKMFSQEWDAQDFLKCFLRFFVYKPNLLMAMSSPNVETGEHLDSQTAQDFSLALARGIFWDTWRCLFWADFDLSLFELEKFEDKYYLDLYKEIYKEYFPFPMGERDFQPCSFIPIFVPQTMPCMYYRKLWCEALALDVHQTFDNEGDTISTGNRLKEIWLNNGALKSQWEMYTQFQGRDPNILAISNFHDPIHDPALEGRKMAAIGS